MNSVHAQQDAKQQIWFKITITASDLHYYLQFNRTLDKAHGNVHIFI